MSINDPISDMLTRVRNAAAVNQAVVTMPSSKTKIAIAEILKNEGYVEDFSVTNENEKPQLSLTLRFAGERRHRRTVITGLRRVSKPGRRVYAGSSELPLVLSGMGIAIVSTPKGLMTGKQARRMNVGGEVLCEIW
ncbi:MAG TPA: 30S ribosomal protein S8 [Anaerolineales bacterium]|nr:30S ribosomal protein S8 [Anaerolineales bacterium]